jgi:hypothetical protein
VLGDVRSHLRHCGTGLRVLSDGRGRLGWARAFLRALLYVIFPVGLLWSAVSRRGRGLDDLRSLRMQFAASSIGQARVRDLPENRVTKTQPLIRCHWKEHRWNNSYSQKTPHKAGNDACSPIPWDFSARG